MSEVEVQEVQLDPLERINRAVGRLRGKHLSFLEDELSGDIDPEQLRRIRYKFKGHSSEAWDLIRTVVMDLIDQIETLSKGKPAVGTSDREIELLGRMATLEHQVQDLSLDTLHGRLARLEARILGVSEPGG